MNVLEELKVEAAFDLTEHLLHWWVAAGSCPGRCPDQRSRDGGGELGGG